MQQRYTGIVIFTKQLDAQIGKFFGFIYCQVLTQAFFFNDRQLKIGNITLAFGAGVEFSVGRGKDDSKEGTATQVASNAESTDTAVPLVPLEIIARIYRREPAYLRDVLNEAKLPVEDGSLCLLSIAQIEIVSKGGQAISRLTEVNQSSRPPEEQLRFGQVIRSEFERGFGFVKDQNGTGGEIFAHIKILKTTPAINSWLVFASESDPKRYGSNRIKWARPAGQEIAWLRINFQKFGIRALDALFSLGDYELTKQVLDWRIDRIGPIGTDKALANAIALMEKVQRLLPEWVAYALARLAEKAEVLEKLRLWGRFGELEHAPYYALILELLYKETEHMKAASMPEDISGIVDLGMDANRAKSIAEAWWPQEKISGWESIEVINQGVSVFRWIKEIQNIFPKSLTTEPTTLERQRRVFVKAIKGQFAALNHPDLAQAIYDTTDIILPAEGFLHAIAGVASEQALQELIQDEDEIGVLALKTAIGQLGAVSTGATFDKLVNWLSIGTACMNNNPELAKQVSAIVLAVTKPIFQLELWNRGFEPNVQWQEIINQLGVKSIKPIALNKEFKAELRLAACRRVLKLFAGDETTFQEQVLAFFDELTFTTPKTLGGRQPIGKIELDEKGRVKVPQRRELPLASSIAAKKELTVLFKKGIDELVAEIGQAHPSLAFELWQAGYCKDFSGAAGLAQLVNLASASPQAPLPDWIRRGGSEFATQMLEMLIAADEHKLLGLPDHMLLPWTWYVLENKAQLNDDRREALEVALFATERIELVTPLWAWGQLQNSTPDTFIARFNDIELEALLQANPRPVRMAAGEALFRESHGSQAFIDNQCLSILSGLGIIDFENTIAPSGPPYVMSKFLGRIHYEKGKWHLGTFEQTFGGKLQGWSKGFYAQESLKSTDAVHFIDISVAIGSDRVKFYLWFYELYSQVPVGKLFDFLKRQENKSNFKASNLLIKRLQPSERLALLEWIIQNNETQVISTWSKTTIQLWLAELPDDEKSRLAWSKLYQLLTPPSLLSLWLADLSEHYDFEEYRLLVLTLPSDEQLLFLRKTFKLIADGTLIITVQQLNTIVRFSKSELGDGSALDYSIDLVLTVLTILASYGDLPGEGDIIEIVCRYIEESTQNLRPIGNTLFAPCKGRAERKKVPAPEKDIVRARIDGLEYLATSDRKFIYVDGEEIAVTDGHAFFTNQNWKISWIVKPGFNYSPDVNDPKHKPDGISLCEGRLANKTDDESGLPFWWCCNRPCYKANQNNQEADAWISFTLEDFINILNLPFNEERYYSFVGLINRTNRILEHLQCRSCERILRPVGQSDFNFYRANKFKCTNNQCTDKQEVYLTHCLNGYCPTVIDSRDSNRCSYRTEGHASLQGMYICTSCGGCCSKQSLIRRKENLEHVYRPEMLTNHQQYQRITYNIKHRLYHWERMRVFCYKCTNPMEQRHSQANYTCINCHTEYRYDQVHIEVARRKNLVEAEQD
jgi:hypothetical protein